MTRPDDHGTPALSSMHGVCAGPDGGAADAYDWNFCWKVWDALQRLRLRRKQNCRYALGNTPQHRTNGRWSDGVAINWLKIQDAAPLRP